MYTQSITRSHRTAFFILLDLSGSMIEQVTYRGRRITKAEAVADVGNSMIFELIERSRRADGVRDYYDVSVLGYSGEGVVSLLPGGDDWLSIARIAALPVEVLTHSVEERLSNGQVVLRDYSMPQWITPKATGETPMLEAFDYVYMLGKRWCSRSENMKSFPPMVFNVSDAEATDGNYDELCAMAQRIKSLSTTDGAFLMINIHISTTGESALIYPGREERVAHRYAELLWECSSELPEIMHDAVRELKGGSAVPPFRGVSYNAPVTELLSLLSIGSISIQID